MRMVKGLEGEAYEGQLRSLGLFFIGLTIVYSFFPWKKSFQHKVSIAYLLAQIKKIEDIANNKFSYQPTEL